MSSRFVVTTTIYPPTPAVQLFDAAPDWTLIVVGDRRTPKDYALDNGIYLSPDDQEKLAPELSDLIGWNCIQRRNIGFVLALDLGAEIVATVDDDNLPYAGWGDNLLVGETAEVTNYDADVCFDPIGATEHGHLWHRGFPLQLLSNRDYTAQSTRKLQVDVQADFWDGDPDVDAVCRMEHAPDVTFDPGNFPFASEALSPFNSQNTFLTAAALREFFVLPGVGRMDDIWAAYHLQWLGFTVVYGAASVRQERNPQDLTRNLVDEFVGYERTHSLIQAMNAGSYDPKDWWPERTLAAYDAYRRRVISR